MLCMCLLCTHNGDDHKSKKKKIVNSSKNDIADSNDSNAIDSNINIVSGVSNYTDSGKGFASSFSIPNSSSSGH